MVDDFARLFVEVADEILVICLGRHAWLRVRYALDEVCVGHDNGGKNAIDIFLLDLSIVQGCCHTLCEKLTGDVIDSALQISFISHNLLCFNV